MIHFIDRYVGKRIRHRRRVISQSMEALSEMVGCTWQQMHKYEVAKNRVSASRLWRIAQAQGVSVAYYFEGAAEALAAAKRTGVAEAA